MKSVHITLFGRIVLFIFAGLLLWAVFYFTGRNSSRCGEQAVIVNPFHGSGDTHDPEKPLRVAIYYGGGFIGGLVENNGLKANRDCNFFKNHRIQVEFVPVEDWDDCRMMLCRETGADIVWADAATYARAYPSLTGANPTAFLHYAWSYGEEAIYARESLAAPDLKKADIACVEGGRGHFLLLYWLNANGLNATDVRWRFTNSDTDSMTLLQKGRARACAVSKAFIHNTQSDSGQSRIILSTRYAPRLMPGVFLAREGFIAANRELITSFMKGWFEGVAQAKEKRDDAIRLMANSYGISDDAAKDLYDNVLLADFFENRSFFELDGASRSGFTQVFELAEQTWDRQKRLAHKGNANIARNTTPLIMTAGDYAKKKAGPPFEFDFKTGSAGELVPVAGALSIDFTKDGSDIDSKTADSLKRFAATASVFAPLPIGVEGFSGFANDSFAIYKWQVRLKNVAGILRDSGVSDKRIIVRDVKTWIESDRDRMRLTLLGRPAADGTALPSASK